MALLTKIFSVRKKEAIDAKIVSNLILKDNQIPYFGVKMRGCNTIIELTAEQIITSFIAKFNQHDIMHATKAYMNYRVSYKLVSIENNFAVLHNNTNNTYDIIDLSENNSINKIDFDKLPSRDSFTLGAQFEKIRSEKDYSLFKLTKRSNNVTPLRVKKSDAK